ncbi:hypothetical protein SAMN04489717_4432 [Actinopolymorpha singaporensis]|uniref:Homeodomain-like domain-containing protein n=1 Tax=Actinopolymorpha singaporensis TaxID=117157 RepID=A0A1H1WAX7_9ACTN|nr:hypothetical protein SAMN04489717_4432 [Actinopolymorpha singaporensis]
MDTLRAKDPLDALGQIAALERRLDAETEIQVRRARVQGCSWEVIAAALGVSRQAVHKRFAGRTGLLRRNRK